jgi:hypothetical protein
MFEINIPIPRAYNGLEFLVFDRTPPPLKIPVVDMSSGGIFEVFGNDGEYNPGGY